jgi:hypothetical protein
MDALPDLIKACFTAINLPYTLLLGVVFLYWLSVIAGALDISVLDFDVDLDGDADIDLDADIDADGDISDVGDGGIRAVLRYFNIGEVPLTIIISFFALSLWTIGILANWYLHRNQSALLGMALIVPNVLVSLHVAKFCSIPFKALFKALDHGSGDQNEDLVGRQCTVTTSTATATFGQVEVKTKGAPLLLSVRTDGETLPRGTSAVIMELDEAAGLYMISKLDMEV